ncbi:MAG: type II toxin-antitoxin system RelE/ParE family toxin [Pseudomonadota bacterium]
MLAEFPDDVRREADFQLDGSWKPMPSIGPGACELRIQESAGAFRVIYVAKFPNVIFVLHAFQKESRKTARLDLELARIRFREMTRIHGQ